MSSNAVGKTTSEVEIQGITAHGVWLLAEGSEYYMPYEQYPWFKDANVSQILNVLLVDSGRLHWPDLDVDLSTTILTAPQRFPLIAKNE